MTRANVAPGCRRLTPEHHRSAEIAARFDGLPAGITRKNQLLAALKQASDALGLSARLRDAIDTLMGWSREQDWLGDGRPIVWPSNQRLQDAWGVTKRQVQNILTRLIQLGLIAAVDGPQGRRGGKRDKDDRIVEAFGFDLSPLAVRYQEFVAAAAEHRKRCAKRDALRRRLTIARKAIRQIAATAIEQQEPGRDWQHWLARAESLGRGRAPGLDLDVLPALVQQLEAIRQDGYEALTAFLKSVETAPSGAADCTPNTPTNQRSADKSATCNDAANESNGRGRPASSRPPSHAQAPAQNAATAALAPGWLPKLCRPLRAYLADDRPTWSEVVDAADYLRASLGISRSAWIDACHTLGRNDAAAAVAVIAARGDEISSPGGYLRGMTGRARAGRLNLMRSLWGLAERRHDG
ncbi:MAG: replication initiation protein RepC [Rhodospirillales bacterium]|jgi:replication initiation protein RepC|nr:replication initiation protein RepC [Rhodospirillales bacterium]